ncbi:amidohydrolase [Oceanospirillum sediminis]|uniref:Amidohydrolase n=1 Tax=Oceanospirillum sediminis TaxID=2760088 RepID=A0A839IS91_9GAMM|nr:amidohydrolase [Oceanospirillum sediminis]MBB1487530.1 amidohydrolase [Oceanospirillum sediminis]
MSQTPSPFALVRQELHQHPELSNQEARTAERIKQHFTKMKPDQIFENLGGHGLAFLFKGANPGPVTLIRCELDALPIQEINDLPYKSCIDGVSHKCGHDGHMAIVTALGNFLSGNKPENGSVICLFQPAEETGAGAIRVVEDETFSQLKPDFCFALHNLPGKPMGQVLCKPGTFNCASRGMIIRLTGKTSHAAHPEDGISPAIAMSHLIEGLTRLPDTMTGFNLVTVVHASLGEIAFGTSPADAVVMATLRTTTNEAMNMLVAHACQLAEQQAKAEKLSVSIEWEDVFGASVNTDTGYQHVMRACQAVGVEAITMEEGFRWSEDFGIFTEVSEGAMFALGSGEHSPQLHNPDYDFPDELIPTGFAVFREIIRGINGFEDKR